MARLQCPDCGVDKVFTTTEKKDLLWFDEKHEERLTYDEARERVRIDDQETSPKYITTKTTLCDCDGKVKFNWEGNHPDDYNWEVLNGSWPPNGDESPF